MSYSAACRTFVAGVVCFLPLFNAAAQTLSDADVAMAIKAGEAKKFDHLTSECWARAGFGEIMGGSLSGGVQASGRFKAIISGNAGRIAFMSAQAKRLYRSIALSDISDDLRIPTVVVSVEPEKPSSSQSGVTVAAPVEHIVLKTTKAGADTVVQPTRVETEPVEWANLVGGKVEANRAIAYFDYQAVFELAGPLELVVITTSGERKCKIDPNDRRRMFPALGKY